MLLGGAALDATGVPLPDETLSVAKQSDAVLLGAIGGCGTYPSFHFLFFQFFVTYFSMTPNVMFICADFI